MAWQVQQGKQRFSELVRRALTEGPQVVTRHGDDVVVVLSAKEYQRLAGTSTDFKAFLLCGLRWTRWRSRLVPVVHR